MEEYDQILLIIISILASAFFSGTEIAFVSANKLKIELDKKHGKISGKIMSYFVKHRYKFITSLLVGNNIALVVYSIAMAATMEPFLKKIIQSDSAILTIQTIFATLVILITGEFLPKSFFRIRPVPILKLFSFPLFISYIILFPFIYIIDLIARTILSKLFKAKLETADITYGRTDLYHYLNEFIKKNPNKKQIENEVQIMKNALDFTKIKARECMIPRNEIVAIDINDSIEELKKKFIETGLSKIIVYRENIDNIIGYVHSYELFKNPKSIKSILRPVAIVPETMLANKILNKLIKEKRSISIVMDEFGGTSGMLTLEDVVEEIIGEIEDEFDTGKLKENKIKDNEFLFSARLEIDYINNKFNLNLPKSDEYETLGGLILNFSENIPKKGEKIIVKPYIFIVEERTEKRIETVKVIIEE